jgi:hypothetical protein
MVVHDRNIVAPAQQFGRSIGGTIVDDKHVLGEAFHFVQDRVDMFHFVVNWQNRQRSHGDSPRVLNSKWSNYLVARAHHSR